MARIEVQHTPLAIQLTGRWAVSRATPEVNDLEICCFPVHMPCFVPLPMMVVLVHTAESYDKAGR
jgi:hypothetical protein